MAKVLGLPTIRGEVILAHTPMKSLVKEYANKRTLVLGHREEILVAQTYGFQKLVTPQVLAAQHPQSYVGWGREHDVVGASLDAHKHEPIEAIMIMHDPVDYHLELQVCIDVLRQRYPASPLRTAPKIFNSNEDLEFASEFDHPRLAQGVFLHCLEMMHEKCPGQLGALELTRFGKPYRRTFEYCEQQLPHANKFYMIGDNPQADIRGANNAGEQWNSVLVLSGMTKQNSLLDPADFVEPNVGEAVKMILAREGVSY